MHVSDVSQAGISLHLAHDNLLERIPYSGTDRGIVPRFQAKLCGNMIEQKALLHRCTMKQAFSLFLCVSFYIWHR